MRILELPVEVLLLIYQSLNDIDDALHLARTCEQLYAIFDSPSSRVNILRCIIQTQCQHKYDIKLTLLQSLNQTYFSSLDLSMGDAQKASRPGPNVLSQVLFPTHPHKLSDEQVWAIVCRWHGIRSLFALYSDPTIHNIYLNDWVPWWHTQCPLLLGNNPLPQLSDQTIHSTPNQKRRLYHRFYQALTSHWLSIECLALAKATVYPSRTSRNQWHKIISAQWYSRGHLNLREKLDILHVTVFVWEFLARKAFETIPLIPRLQEFRTRKVFLRPPSVIQAVILQNWPDPDSMCDLMEYFEHLTPEYTIQQAIAWGEHEGHEEPGYFDDENAGAWCMGLQDLEKCTHDYLRQVKITPQTTWRWYWPASLGGNFGKRPMVCHPGDGGLSISVLDRLFLCPETDERSLVEMLYRV
ncbi:hypothetical protein AFCA_001920 [Aspergillus flavus]|nr:hypothetical protein AFCA_001920 [Aspergillus flavus]